MSAKDTKVALKDVSNSAIDDASAFAHKAIDDAAGAITPAAAWVSEKTEHLNATQKTARKDASKYISRHPLKSVGFALAAGFLLSRLFS